jgi:phosphoribosyl 1,2-cyclic phosphodiesterase
MKVAVLGSGSNGNAVALSAEGTVILLDAGFSLRTLRRRLDRAGMDFSQVAGIVLTHEHNDHASGATRIAARAGCPIYASKGTFSRVDRVGRPALRAVNHLHTFAIGPFEITPCRTMHDAVDPMALSVTGPRGETVVLAYDMGGATPALRKMLRRAECLIVESNHDESMLRTGPYPPSVRRRIGGPEGHLSNRAAAQLLAGVCHDGVETVVLAHISQICNRKVLAKEAALEALSRRKYRGRLLLAEQDTPLDAFDVGLSSSAQLRLL